MNPMTNVKNIKKLSELELKRGNLKSSWHDQYKGSAWLFVGGLSYELTEGDVICVFSQYGEIVNINLVRDKGTGKSKGFCFLCYEDQRSTVLAVDNFNGTKLLGRTIRVDHVSDYKVPKDSDKMHQDTRKLLTEGCAPKPIAEVEKIPEVVYLKEVKKEKKEKITKVKPKKEKKRNKKKKKKQPKVEESSSSSSYSSSSDSDSDDESDSNSKKSKRGKAKHSSKKHKKRSHSSESESSSQDEVVESAKSKRKKLEEKIKVLEQALNSVKNSSRKNPANADNQAGNLKPRDSGTRSDYEQEKCLTSADHQNKWRYDGEINDGGGGRRREYNSHSSSDHQDRNSVRNENYRNRDSGARRGEENGLRDNERCRERYDDRGRDKYRERDNREYERERDRYRDRSRDGYRR